MGNNGSHTGAITASTESQLQRQQWAHSFPRDLQRAPHLKVLPDPVTHAVPPRLRSTDNGAILNAEGTIRGKRLMNKDDEYLHGSGMYRSRSIHASHSHTRENASSPLHRTRTQMYRDRAADHQGFNNNAKRFGSEPDLRAPTGYYHGNDGFAAAAKNRISRGRKKYKAPAPPPETTIVKSIENSSPQNNHWERISTGDISDTNAPGKRLRLFKTRAETNRNNHNHFRAPGDRREDKKDVHPQYKHQNGHSEDYKNEMREKTSSREYLDSADKHKDVVERRHDEKSENSVVMRREKEIKNMNRNSAPPVMHRSVSSPEFQAELRAVTQRLRAMDKKRFDRIEQGSEHFESKPTVNSTNNDRNSTNNNNRIDRRKKEAAPVRESKEQKMITMDHHNIAAKQLIINAYKENLDKKNVVKDEQDSCKDSARQPKYSRESSSNSHVTEVSRGQASGKESTPEQSPSRKTEIRNNVETPKTFYFGMDVNDINGKIENRKNSSRNDNVNHLNTELHNMKHQETKKQHGYTLPAQTSSESALSSEPELDESQPSNSGISMQLRPTLPKKQLEIPRFSPATAWRLLSVVDATHPQNSTGDSEEGLVLVEERIERLSRPTPAIQLVGQRSSYDKSGDSGISGDAGPALMEDIPEPVPLPHAKTSGNRPLVAWTPQQDLEEEASSSDGGLESPKAEPSDVKYNARTHVFSLSLPRESHLAVYNGNDKSKNPQVFNSLQKLRKSLGAALGTHNKLEEDSPVDNVDDNWFLSTSAPNSINNSPATFKLSRTHSDEDEHNFSSDKEPVMLKSPSYSYLANGGHVMYLPTMEGNNFKVKRSNDSDDVVLRNKVRTYEPNSYRRDDRNSKRKSIDMQVLRKEYGFSHSKISSMSKSCDNITEEMRQINRTPSPKRNQFQESCLDDFEKKMKNGKGKKFTFQSTVRQIERRRIAEKLSKEAERKERQRLGELEAMRKVEEEFQRKRAKEKANIRQQLRLFTMNENASNGVMNDWEITHPRSEPDGAVSSPAPSPTNQTVIGSKLNVKSKDQTPYVNKIVEQRMSQSSRNNHESSRNNQTENNSRNTPDHGSKMSHANNKNYDCRSGSDISKRSNHRKEHRSSPVSKSSDDSHAKAPVTEVLSEYREPRREYRDYRGLPRFSMENNIEPQTTVHPPVVYNMPKASHGYSYHQVEGSASPCSDNYRRDFAHGTIPTSSDSELSQPNTRPQSPRHLPRLRARSASPNSDRNEDINKDNLIEDVEKNEQYENAKEKPEQDKKNDTETDCNNTEPVMLNINKLVTIHPYSPNKSYRPVSFKIK